MNEDLMRKLRKVLALTTSSEEGEAQMAARILANLLKQHNLSVADLEEKGAAKPEVEESGVDLGKANFKWKLSLADVLARHYFCHAIIDWSDRRFCFVGRPDNVESLKMLYAWLVDQIKALAAKERRAHHVRTGEHVDPLRWQLSFGEGAVDRLGERLEEQRQQERDDASTAMVLHHGTEISDYLEKTRGFRVDGLKTAAELKYEERTQKLIAELEALKACDIEAYYERCPWDRPETEEEKLAREAAREKRWAEERKREERNARRRVGRVEKPETAAQIKARLDRQAASEAGFAAGDKVNLKPFIAQDKDVPEDRRLS